MLAAACAVGVGCCFAAPIGGESSEKNKDACAIRALCPSVGKLSASVMNIISRYIQVPQHLLVQVSRHESV